MTIYFKNCTNFFYLGKTCICRFFFYTREIWCKKAPQCITSCLRLIATFGSAFQFTHHLKAYWLHSDCTSNDYKAIFFYFKCIGHFHTDRVWEAIAEKRCIGNKLKCIRKRFFSFSSSLFLPTIILILSLSPLLLHSSQFLFHFMYFHSFTPK